MNEAPQLEIVDLGDAKEETKGLKEGPRAEDDVFLPRRLID
ncbi:rubrivinodin family lasso peptide [Roseateles sp.]